jgi:integrase
MVLLLATYGWGAAEVLGLRLEDLDWKAGVLRARRPKTNVSIELPRLPAAAKALTRISTMGTAACQINTAPFPPQEYAL